MKMGISNFGALQNWRSEADGELIYYLFDILWLDGHDLRELPLTERRNNPENLSLPSGQYYGSAKDLKNQAFSFSNP